MNTFQSLLHRSNLESNFKLPHTDSAQISKIKLLSFKKKKQKKFKIQKLFHRKLTIRRLEPNLKPCHTRFKLRQTIFRFFSTFFFILQKKKQILKERFIQSLYFIKNVCPNIKFPFGQGKFYDYPTSANIQDLKRCPRPCERVRANW